MPGRRPSVSRGTPSFVRPATSPRARPGCGCGEARCPAAWPVMASGQSTWRPPTPACGTCHLPLPEATALSRERIAHFPAPPYHFDASFPMAHADFAQPPPADGRLLHRCLLELCHLSRAGLLHLLPRERAGSAGHSGARARPSVTRYRDQARGTREPCRSGVHPAPRPSGSTQSAELRRMPYPGELPDVPRGPAGGRGGYAYRGARTGVGGVGQPPPSRHTWRRLHRPACAGCIGRPQKLRGMPCARGLPRLPSAERSFGAGIPPRWLSLAPSRVRLRAGDHVRGVPQQRRLLCRLSSEGRAHRPRGPSRRLP